MSSPTETPPPVAPTRSPRRLALRWKAFIVFMVLLSVVYGLLGAVDNQRLRREMEQQTASRIATLDARLQHEVDTETMDVARLAAQLAATVHSAELDPQALDAALAPEVQALLQHAELFDGTGRSLVRWPDGDETGLAAPTIGAALRQVHESHAPSGFIACVRALCEHHVFVPAINGEGQEFVVQLSTKVDDLLFTFAQETGADVLLLAPEESRQGGSARTDPLGSTPAFGGHALLALSNAPQLRPLIARLTGMPAPGAGAQRRMTVDGHTVLLVGGTPSGPARGLSLTVFVLDLTPSIARMDEALRQGLYATLLGLSVTGGLLLLLLTTVARRLERITAALPLLAEEKFAQARALLAEHAAGPLHDEVDVLRDAATHLATRLERLRSAEAESEAKSRFLATVSHEIRTPMNGIVGLSELLVQSELPEDARRHVRLINESAQALVHVIDDILNYSKLEAGRLNLECVPFELRDIVESAAETISPQAQNKKLRVVVYVAPDLPAQVIGDPVRLRQVLLNLCGNAVKFTASGAVRIRAESGGGTRVRFCVRDTGIGIDPAAQIRLFEPFTQAESSTTRRYGGTGLGLAISRGFVQQMGGDIAVASAPGQGSEFCFEVELPAAMPAQAEQLLAGECVQLALQDPGERADLESYLRSAGARIGAGPDAVCVTDDPSGQGFVVTSARDATAAGRRLFRPLRRAALLSAVAVAAGRVDSRRIAPRSEPAIGGEPKACILVAEDHPTNQLVIASQLHRLGHPVQLAADGQEALDLLARQDYALLLSDLHMPVLDGYGLAAAVRRREREQGAARRLPIVALTANALEGEKDRCVQAGMDDYLAKPVTLDRLSAVLARWLNAVPVVSAAPVLAGARAASASAANAPAPADLSRLRADLGGDEALLREALRQFVIAGDGSLAELAQTLTDGDRRLAQMLAHRLKGSARTIGAQRLSDAAVALEQAAAGVSGMESQAAELRACYAELRSFLETQIA